MVAAFIAIVASKNNPTQQIFLFYFIYLFGWYKLEIQLQKEPKIHPTRHGIQQNDVLQHFLGCNGTCDHLVCN